MADKQIDELDSFVAVDRTVDLLPLLDVSIDETVHATVNQMLGFSGGNPVSTSDTQTLSNKVLGITNTVTLVDNLFTLQDNADNTKQAQFQLSGITTGNTRTYTLPNASGTLVDLASSQTLTNKTISGGAVNNATIDNPVLQTDTVSEHTAANGVTVDGLNIKDGKLNTNSSVVTANITDAAVTPAKLVAGTGSTWALQTWTPTWTNLTVGNATTSYGYIQVGKMVHFRMKLVFGSTTAITGTGLTFTLPVNSNAAYQGAESAYIGHVKYLDTGVGSYPGVCQLSAGDATKGQILAIATGGTYAASAANTSTVPFTFGLADEIHITGSYEAA